MPLDDAGTANAAYRRFRAGLPGQIRPPDVAVESLQQPLPGDVEADSREDRQRRHERNDIAVRPVVNDEQDCEAESGPAERRCSEPCLGPIQPAAEYGDCGHPRASKSQQRSKQRADHVVAPADDVALDRCDQLRRREAQSKRRPRRDVDRNRLPVREPDEGCPQQAAESDCQADAGQPTPDAAFSPAPDDAEEDDDPGDSEGGIRLRSDRYRIEDARKDATV